ncbi:Cocaine esterase [compost metagenome]
MKPSLIEPNTPYQFDLEVGNTAMVLPKGHRIRVQISSSNFPLYARNLNTGADNNTTSDFVVANQTLLHGPTQLSFIELPVAPISRPQ